MTLVITWLLSFLIVLSAIGVMAIGALLGRGRIRGSCGGIGNGACELCGESGNERQAHGIQDDE